MDEDVLPWAGNQRLQNIASVLWCTHSILTIGRGVEFDPRGKCVQQGVSVACFFDMNWVVVIVQIQMVGGTWRWLNREVDGLSDGMVVCVSVSVVCVCVNGAVVRCADVFVCHVCSLRVCLSARGAVRAEAWPL
jgi:hypothetical protein